MNNTVGYILAFIGGAAISGFVTWKVANKMLDEKYEARYQEDLKSVKERFTVPKAEKKPVEVQEEKKDNGVVLDKSSITEYYKKIKPYAAEAAHTNYSNVEYEAEEKAHFEPRVDRIDVIKPDEFDNEEEFEKQELTLYADGTLADEDDTVLDPEEIAGESNLRRMGEYEDGALYVKNYFRRVVYQILEDRRYYEDVTGKDPHPSKDEEEK